MIFANSSREPRIPEQVVAAEWVQYTIGDLHTRSLVSSDRPEFVIIVFISEF